RGKNAGFLGFERLDRLLELGQKPHLDQESQVLERRLVLTKTCSDDLENEAGIEFLTFKSELEMNRSRSSRRFPRPVTRTVMTVTSPVTMATRIGTQTAAEGLPFASLQLCTSRALRPPPARCVTGQALASFCRETPVFVSRHAISSIKPE